MSHTTAAAAPEDPNAAPASTGWFW